MDAIRKQLDVLMGANRNGDVREVSRSYYDRDVCRLFLVGLCPHDLFQLTAMLLLDAFNKDRASLPQPNQNTPQPAPLPVLAPPDPRTQEMINEKLRKAEELGEKGMIDEAQKALEEAEALKKLGARQEPLVESSKYTAADVRITDQKLRLCDICEHFERLRQISVHFLRLKHIR
ncbi:putative RNA-binding protein Luc7-like 2 [Ananas comosus]|uniref:Putative RNA-binding protein Luc7-like 2 n=1 Tax=Ananas comosus TaxID=4615 RepID=A0A199VP33_ANACO|nr:putative RNA-binding protein Luc7-like 2 [Ananas comosus]